MKQAIKHRKNYLPWERRLCLALLAILGCILSFSTAYAQQGGLSRYVYDDNGRLRGVIAPNGEANIYEYDPAGNFTAIRRNTANTLEVIGFTPREGVPGTQVTLVGTGFGGGVTSVAFNGTVAQIISASAPVVVVTVPDGATTGPLTLTTPQGNITTAEAFAVKGIKLSPATASLNANQTVQFTAQVYPLSGSQTVTWDVNFVNGGNSASGTISGTGLYTAPAFPFQPVTVRVTSTADPLIFAEADISFAGIIPKFTPAALGVSVKRSTPNNATFAVAGGGVSIRRATPNNATYAPVGAGVSATKGPYIAQISPSNLPKGATTPVTIQGANLTGAASLALLDGTGANDTNITVSNINVNAGGDTLTANVTVNGSATLGQRLVIVTTANNRSQAGGTGSNLIQIVP